MFQGKDKRCLRLFFFQAFLPAPLSGRIRALVFFQLLYQVVSVLWTGSQQVQAAEFHHICYFYIWHNFK